MPVDGADVRLIQFETWGLVIVEDNEDPEIVCPQDISTQVNIGTCGAIVEFEAPEALDNSGTVGVEQTVGPASEEIFPVGNTTVAFTATDEAGNSVQCSFTVTVEDNEAPQITSCPGDIAISTDTDTCTGSAVELKIPVVTDNCDDQLTISNNAPDNFEIGITEVTWIISDAAGNTTTCTQIVTVNDSTMPYFN